MPFDLGVEVGRVRLTVFAAASLLVGASVASSGSVGYVGLVVPHLVRLSFGSVNRLVCHRRRHSVAHGHCTA